MRRSFRVVVLGVATACAGDGDASVPRADEACAEGEPARCGFGEGANATRNTVLVCDGDRWSQGLECGPDETCRDDEGRGAVVCTDGGDPVIYGEHTGACAVAGAQSCSFERDFVLVCEAGTWAIGTNCSTDVQHCTRVTSDDDDTCSDAQGCLVCA